MDSSQVRQWNLVEYALSLQTGGTSVWVHVRHPGLLLTILARCSDSIVYHLEMCNLCSDA
jgi:hypothetical protein